LFFLSFFPSLFLSFSLCFVFEFLSKLYFLKVLWFYFMLYAYTFLLCCLLVGCPQAVHFKSEALVIYALKSRAPILSLTLCKHTVQVACLNRELAYASSNYARYN
jgi:hypothetical protein